MGRSSSIYGSVVVPDDAEVEPLLDGPLMGSRKRAVDRGQAVRRAAGALLGLMGFLAVFAVVTTRGSTHRHVNTHRKAHAAGSKPSLYKSAGPQAAHKTRSVEFSVTNAYGTHVYKTTDYPWLDGKKLLEPYKPTTLSILNPDSALTYTWEVSGPSGVVVAELEGEAVEVIVKEPGKYSISVSGADVQGAKLVEEVETAYVVYVRREMRGLTDDDREAYLDAFKVLYNTSHEDGVNMYGPNFRTIYHFVDYHLSMADSKYCDRLHNGLGFLTGHVALTLKMEQSVQSVNPAVVLPYWDFTIDLDDIRLKKAGDFSKYWLQTEPFTDKYFGATDPVERTVTTGRFAWAMRVIKFNASTQLSGTQVTSPYGMMRAPWNAHKRPWLTRSSYFCGYPYNVEFDDLPSCVNHYNIISDSNTWWEFGLNIQGDPHGPVHALTGGMFGCEEAFDNITALVDDDTFMNKFAVMTYGLIRTYWRDDLYTCPRGCTDDTPQDECVCGCDPAEVVKQYTSLDDAVGAYAGGLTLTSEEDKYKFLEYICSAKLLVGDNIEGASPLDPSFWPIHPTLLRLFEAKKLWGFIADLSWPDGSSEYDDCSGHNAQDVVPLDDVYPGVTGQMTNEEILAKMDPTSDDRHFIFDNFDWSHCLDTQGIDFRNMTMGVTIGLSDDE